MLVTPAMLVMAATMLTVGAVRVIVDSADTLIAGEVSEIDAGVIVMALNPTVSVIDIMAVVEIDWSTSMVWSPAMVTF